MSVIWSGITEEGAVVPVQVTEEGKVVAVGDGPEGDYLKLTGGNLTGNLTLGTDNKITLNATDGSGEFVGDLTAINSQFRATAAGAFAFSRDNENYQVSMNSGAVSFTGPTSCAIQGFYKDTNTNTFAIYYDGSAEFKEGVLIGSDFSTGTGCRMVRQGQITVRRDDNTKNVFEAFNGGSATSNRVIELGADGSADFAGGKCGFTTEGDLIFTSRGTRYKLFVSQGVCQAEPYTREMELKEKAEQFIADKRETKPSNPSTQSQPEVTSDNDNA